MPTTSDQLRSQVCIRDNRRRNGNLWTGIIVPPGTPLPAGWWRHRVRGEVFTTSPGDANRLVTEMLAELTPGQRGGQDLNYWIGEANNETASNTRRIYCFARAVVRLCAHEPEQGDPHEDAAYLASIVQRMTILGTETALLADARKGRGVAAASKKPTPAGSVRALLDQLSALQMK